MDRVMYSSLSAMRSLMARQTAVANNLANAATPGFRADMEAQQALWVRGGASGMDSRAYAGEQVHGADMTEGAMNATGRPLDVAFGEGQLLAVQGPDGQEAYTRRGDLQQTDSGLLTTGDGKPVLGEGGPIMLPPADKIMIAKDGTINIVPAGQDPSLPPVMVDRLKVVGTAGVKIAKGEDGLFHAAEGGTLPASPEPKVTAETLEASNVNTAQALVQMIDAARSWEAQVKMMQEAKQIDVSAAELMKLD
ncbi:flagellar basal body rod protein FlgF [Sphingomonas jatrophae]|uniref:Flagellar basal-body rod protein FlgF n=1 Tax=Sphingomonas jatrophae TaxID=1166337 RepID=A0A1I6MAP8_9SPHN|nr:flagellar basal body rod protein FlgF [Sphingomonas jatrophae]SFS12789.1 flagellar basal-body rod protein FlgF [Sphingomonas jatrophae]